MILSKVVLSYSKLRAMTSLRRCFTTKLHKHQEELMKKNLPKQKPIPGVKHIILVSSGKGGVGKSTTSVNLATALKVAFPNKHVGLLDADVFGPSIPLMMNLHDSPILNDQNLMLPLENYSVKCMSMGFLISEGSPVIWRGLMVMQALEKLFRQVEWGSIDYLIVDTPPGTGDTHLSLVQNLPIAGVILVTTPQTAALQVTKRGANMYKKLNIPIIGIVENMNSVTCTECANKLSIFGDGTSTLAKEIHTKILQSLPIDPNISLHTDKGVPIVIASPQSPQTQCYLDLAKQIVAYLNK